MEKKQWVQHISGQGEKWEVVVDNAGNAYQWWVRSGPAPCGWHYLPKSEYVLCDPPEVWRDVTEKLPCSSLLLPHSCGQEWRVRKVAIEREYPKDKQWAFIVEQKVAQ